MNSVDTLLTAKEAKPHERICKHCGKPKNSVQQPWGPDCDCWTGCDWISAEGKCVAP